MENLVGKLEAILFAVGREVTKKELITSLEISNDELEQAIATMKDQYELDDDRGIQIVQVGDAYTLASKLEMHEYIYNIIDKRVKPKLSNASLETLAIIAYNPRITRAEIEAIRGVSADGCVYKLLEYGMIEEAGKTDLPGKPMSYKTTNEFLKSFGYDSNNDLPVLPKYKLDENRQIVIDEVLEAQEVKNEGEDEDETITNGNGND